MSWSYYYQTKKSLKFRLTENVHCHIFVYNITEVFLCITFLRSWTNSSLKDYCIKYLDYSWNVVHELTTTMMLVFFIVSACCTINILPQLVWQCISGCLVAHCILWCWIWVSSKIQQILFLKTIFTYFFFNNPGWGSQVERYE